MGGQEKSVCNACCCLLTFHSGSQLLPVALSVERAAELGTDRCVLHALPQLLQPNWLNPTSLNVRVYIKRKHLFLVQQQTVACQWLSVDVFCAETFHCNQQPVCSLAGCVPCPLAWLGALSGPQPSTVTTWTDNPQQSHKEWLARACGGEHGKALL